MGVPRRERLRSASQDVRRPNPENRVGSGSELRSELHRSPLPPPGRPPPGDAAPEAQFPVGARAVSPDRMDFRGLPGDERFANCDVNLPEMFPRPVLQPMATSPVPLSEPQKGPG